MDEQKGKGVPLRNATESTVAAAEHVAVGSQNLGESVVSKVQSQGQGQAQIEGSSYGEGLTGEGEDGASCNEDDIMVEVLGSHVYVDGICTTDGASGVGGNSNEQAVHGDDASNQAGFQGHMRSSEGERSGGGGFDSSNIGVSGGEPSSKLGTETAVMMDEELERKDTEKKGVKRSDEVIERREGNAVGETSLQGDGTLKDNAQNGGTGAGLEGSLSSGDLLDGETHSSREKVVVNASEQSGLPKEDVEKIEKSGGTQVLTGENVTTMESGGKLARGVVGLDAEQHRESDDGGGNSHPETEKVGGFGGEVLKHGNQNVVVCSSSLSKDSSVQVQVSDDARMMTYDEGMDPKDDAPASDSVEGNASSSDRNQTSVSGSLSGVTENSDALDRKSESLDVKVQVAAEGEATDDLPCSETKDLISSRLQKGSAVGDLVQSKVNSKMEQEMEIDKRVSNIEEQQMKVEAPRSTESHDNLSPVSANLGHNVQEAAAGNDQGLQDDTSHASTSVDSQVIERGDEVALVNNQEGLNSNNEVLGPAEACLDKRMTSASAQVHSSSREKMEVDKQVTGAENETLYGEHEVQVENQLVKDAEGEEFDWGDNNDNAALGHAEGDQQWKSEECFDKGASQGLYEDSNDFGEDASAEEHVGHAEEVSLHQGQEMEVEEQDTDSEHPSNTEEKFVKRTGLRPGSSIKVQQAKYQLPPEDDSEFFVSDLVWGKVRSHPWWPGQIFDPSDASEKAMKYYKKDCFLVAYFGDRTFAWNEASLLKPFRTHFSQIEKQSSSEAFQNAVDCALEEVSRRVEWGLACSCIPKDIYDNIRFQVVENTGIRNESSIKDGCDRCMAATTFDPHKFVEYVKALAECPFGGADRLDLVIAKAQLLALHRFKGYNQLPEFQFCGGLIESEASTSPSEETMPSGEVIGHAHPMDTDDQRVSSGHDVPQNQRSSYLKRKHNLKDGLHPSKKERSLSELMGETWDSPDVENGLDGKNSMKLASPTYGKKRKAVDSFAEDSTMQEGRKAVSLAKVSPATPNLAKPSFKIGECIRRAASQMTGSPSIMKPTVERLQKLDGGSDSPAGDGYDVPFEDSDDGQRKRTSIPTEYSSLDELLSQLHLAACDPLKEYSFINDIITIFSDLRRSTVLDGLSAERAGGKRRFSNSIIGSSEPFEFEDMNDTYWTDRIVQNGSEEQPSQGNGKGEYSNIPGDLDKPQRGRKSRKRYSDGNHDLASAAEKPPGYVDEKAPAEIVMSFTDINSVPSEIKLNKMFRHFGPLKESETEVDRETSRARVVFKKCADAEVAFNSAGKFNIFGQVAVNYQLNYSISESFKASLYAPTLAEETQLVVPPLGEDAMLVTSTLGYDTHLIAPTLSEEASFMVSTLHQETLPVSTTLGEETSSIATTLVEEALPAVSAVSEETLPVVTTVCENTLPVATTLCEETLTVATSIGETSTIATTVNEETLTAPTTVSEETFTVAATANEENSSFATAMDEQTSNFATTMGEDVPNIATSMGEEVSNITTTMGGEASVVVTTMVEETSTVVTTMGEETPIVATTIVEETSTVVTTMGEETSWDAGNLGEANPADVTTMGKETSPDATSWVEATSAVATSLGDATLTVATPMGDRISMVATTSGQETSTFAVFPDETSTIPTTLGGETSTISSSLSEGTSTVAATLSDETLSVPMVNEASTVVTVSGKEASAVPTNLGKESSTIVISSGEEISAVPTTLGKESVTVATALGEENSTIATTLSEDEVATSLGTETSPTNVIQGNEAAT